MRGRIEDLFGWARLYDLAFVQDGDTLADSSDRRQIVRDVENRRAEFAIQASEELQDFGLRDDVEGAGGFVGDQERGAMHNGHRDEHPLRLAYAELRGALVQEVFVLWPIG